MGDTKTILNTKDYKGPYGFKIKLTLKFYNFPQPRILNSLLSGSIHIKMIFLDCQKKEKEEKNV